MISKGYSFSIGTRHLTYNVFSRPSYVIKGLLTIIPITTFGLGTWQYYRLKWKTRLIEEFEKRMSNEPLKLTKDVNFSDIISFEYQKVLLTGRFIHDQEILVGPRLYEGRNGYHVITPMELGDGRKCLINRGWIPFYMADQSKRTEGMPIEEVTIKGLIRLPPKSNLFTPKNQPELKKYYYINIEEISKLTESENIYIEQLIENDFIMAPFLATKGKPIGKLAEIQVRNKHLEYMVTWYSLSIATLFMLYHVFRQSPTSLIARRVNQIKRFS
ncbi:hypothetical protein T552_02844 [Pneumocystis carinii B80]|uniref:SURF1-like protein n=1 Tax=Pneumocystis carinii (strain B80) TaxID=1408658 RepID=A0A0W4ZDH4_PNEC8|nr:hypothetical protein T552_02844 [Pneumocystis carinii B80]KTW26362.1 hypothetical protein T552_02844 [Pneumocystis carinii B80]